MGDGWRQAVPLVGLAFRRGPGAGDAGLLGGLYLDAASENASDRAGESSSAQRGAKRAGIGPERDRANSVARGTGRGAPAGGGAETGGAETGGAETGGAETGGAETGGSATARARCGRGGAAQSRCHRACRDHGG